MSFPAAPLSRRLRAGPGTLPVLGEMTLARARTHEFCGPARRTLALAVAAACDGPVIWIVPAWQVETLNGAGLAAWLDPGRLLLVRAPRTPDLLWSMEESLRAGAAPLVVAELPEPPDLTPVRRLHLAAKTGATNGPGPPLGLLLTPGDGGAPGVESRWHLAPAHGTRHSRWRLERRRARTAPPADWLLGQERYGPEGRLRLCPAPPQSAPTLRT